MYFSYFGLSSPIIGAIVVTLIAAVQTIAMTFGVYKDIDFKFYMTFSNQYLLKGENEKEKRSFFHIELIEFFEREQVQHIEWNVD